MRLLARLAPLALVAVALSVPASTPPAAAVTKNVSISGQAFQSASVTVAQGTTVRWTNNDTVTHSSQSNGGFWSSPNLPARTTYQQTAAFRNAGSYAYHCRQHRT
jgi:plastocyanin